MSNIHKKLLGVITLIFLLLLSIHISFASPPLNIVVYGEGDFTGTITENPFLLDSNILLTIEVKNIRNYTGLSPAPQRGAVLKIQVWGDARTVKQRCIDTGIIDENCGETDPFRIYGAWNAYALTIGDTISLHARLLSSVVSPGWIAEDDSVKITRLSFIKNQIEKNATEIAISIMAGVIVILLATTGILLKRKRR